MKKAISIISFALLLALTFSLAGCSKTENSTQDASASDATVGGYTDERELTDEDLDIFTEATAELNGVLYEPEKVSTQVVAGINYRFYCKTTAVAPDAEAEYKYVTVFKSLDESEPAVITEIADA